MLDLSELGSAKPIHTGSATGPAGLAYDQMVKIAQEIQENDPTFVFAGLRPIYDEVWNLMDGQRTLETIREVIGFQFDVLIPQRSINELVKHLVDSGFVRLDISLA